ncbi:MAG: HEAT repeat domain-containing protein [Hormoscilla sp. GM7CHS1pb]|nr:HEAT repeat domain-containing protein [Hormoscilla sp. GM7CHS1pb]
MIAERVENLGQKYQVNIAELVQQYDRSELTSREAAESLGKIDTVSTIAGLVQLLQKTRNEETRRKVAEILGKIGKGIQRRSRD